MESFSPLVLSIAATSFVTFQCLFHFVSPWISAQFFPGYHRLSPRHTIEWNSRTVSTLHAFIVGLFCLYILLHDDAVNEDPVWGDPSLVKINVAITCGYLLSDMLLICYYWRAIGDKFFVIHHLAALYAYYYVLVSSLLTQSRMCRQDGEGTWAKGEHTCSLMGWVRVDNKGLVSDEIVEFHFSQHCIWNTLIYSVVTV
uniref:Si:dkey-10f21.4 n=1 Tax=Oncorhynchus mykiss TaxID=8022 RepID=A0A8K9XUF9_ONCMY